jgi:molecular chaperone DnaJ
VVIHVAEHEQFERQGSNLYEAVPITFAQAALGADIMVKTLDEEEKLKIPMGTQTGTVFRLRGKGMPSSAARSRRLVCFRDCHHADDADDANSVACSSSWRS